MNRQQYRESKKLEKNQEEASYYFGRMVYPKAERLKMDARRWARLKK